MSTEPSVGGPSCTSLRYPAKIRVALELILEAHEYARDVDRDVWEFAVEIKRLLKAGLSRSDLRWLVCKGYVMHGREVTLDGDNRRRFLSTGELSFTRRTCFVLTEAGIRLARTVVVPAESSPSGLPTTYDVARADANGNGQAIAATPRWDGDRHELHVGDRLVKRFRWPASNQETVLAAFEEEGWPVKIDDPLPPQPMLDPKRRLNDTIKCLNRKQKNHVLHFRSDGTGEGVVWEFVEVDAFDGD